MCESTADADAPAGTANASDRDARGWPIRNTAAGTSASISRQITWAPGRMHIGPVKTPSGERAVALDDATVALLRRHHHRQNTLRHTIGTRWRGGAWVFTLADGRPIHPDWLIHRFHTLLTATGLPPPVRLHDLRHGAGSLALAAHTDMKPCRTCSDTPATSTPPTPTPTSSPKSPTPPPTSSSPNSPTTTPAPTRHPRSPRDCLACPPTRDRLEPQQSESGNVDGTTTQMVETMLRDTEVAHVRSNAREPVLRNVTSAIRPGKAGSPRRTRTYNPRT